MRNTIAVLLSGLAFACGGQVQNTSDGVAPAPSNAQGAYVLSDVVLSDVSAFGRAAVPLAQSLCPQTPIESWTATVSVNASGHGLMVLSSACLSIHVPLEVASLDSTSLSALVPTEQLVGAWSADLAASDESGSGTCDTAKLVGSRMRAASDATVSVDSAATAAALTLDLKFGSRESGDAPTAPATDPCAGRD